MPLKLTLILSVSMPVFAIRILAFSIFFGWFTPIFLSSKNPVLIESIEHCHLIGKMQYKTNETQLT